MPEDRAPMIKITGASVLGETFGVAAAQDIVMKDSSLLNAQNPRTPSRSRSNSHDENSVHSASSAYSYGNRIARLDGKLLETEKEVGGLAQKVEILQTDVVTLTGVMDVMKTDIAGMKADIADMKQMLEAIMQHLRLQGA